METRWLLCLDIALRRGTVNYLRASRHVQDRPLLRSSWIIPIASPDRPHYHVALLRLRRVRYQKWIYLAKRPVFPKDH